ncbi:MAG: Geminivirus Rep catalytic domain [Bacteroidota bacterium]|jgi:hypothetical protein
MNREDVLKQLYNLFPKNLIVDYLIAKENHGDEDGEHIHALITFEKKQNIVNLGRFDLIDPETSEIIVGRYKMGKEKHHLINEIKKKDENYLFKKK